MMRDCHDDLPACQLASWTPEQLDYMHDISWWRANIEQTEGAEIVEMRDIQKQCEKLKIKDSVIFFGFQENPYKFISKADLFVLSSDYEGFSLVICETLFLHKRVVTTRCNSDLDDLITPDYGVIVPIGNKKELINAIKREVMTRKNVENIPGLLNRFSIKTVANKYLDYLNGNE